MITGLRYTTEHSYYWLTKYNIWAQDVFESRPALLHG